MTSYNDDEVEYGNVTHNHRDHRSLPNDHADDSLDYDGGTNKDNEDDDQDENGGERQQQLYKSSQNQEVFLHKEELALNGEELEAYCQKHGLCHLCAQTKTHKRVFRLKIFRLKDKNQWHPITIKSKNRGSARSHYIVYKGYCVQP